MFRYLALIWDMEDPQQSATAHSLARQLQGLKGSWREALDSGGLRIFCADIRRGALEVHPLTQNRGVVIGAIFARHRDIENDAPSPRPAFDEGTTSQVLESRGKWLITHCWGNYVAFLTDAPSGRVRVIKDPAGSLPCFSTTFRGVTLVFSAIADCLAIAPLAFTCNRQFLKARVYGTESYRGESALREVDQIRRGECIEIDPRRRPAIAGRTFYWTPFDYPQSAQLLDDPAEAARALRAVLLNATATFAACYDSLLLRLSGGLDSSITLGCLKEAPARPKIAAYTHYGLGNGSDSRRWARMAAQRAGCIHTEHEIVPDGIDLKSLLDYAPVAEPSGNTMMPLATFARERELTARYAASAVFTGDGGDCVLGSLCVADALPDYLRRHGLRPAAFRIASQSALVLGRTVWNILGRGCRSWMTGRPMVTMRALGKEGRLLVSQGLREEMTHAQGMHPWLGAMDTAPWGLISKLGVLLMTPDFYAGSPRPDIDAAEIVAPMWSQPMIELSLRIPADVLFLDGRDRGLARRAFSAEVPAPILNRLWKDRAGVFHDELLRKHLDWLREIFLDGVLVEEGLLDRAAVEHALSARPAKCEVRAGEILMHLDTEIWARAYRAPARPHFEHTLPALGLG